MYIRQVRLHNFRCIQDYAIPCNRPITLIYGPNACGKTSILEALYYAAYLRSFRTMHPSQMIKFDADAFTINIDGTSYTPEEEAWHLHVGCSHKKRLVKKNKQAISSYKELITFYRVMHIIEDDMDIIKGSPKSRRTFIDQSLFLYDHTYAHTMRTYKKVVLQRNALVARGQHHETVWLRQMWQYAHAIVQHRLEWLTYLQEEANALLKTFFSDAQITLTYRQKHTVDASFDVFYERYQKDIQPEEAYTKRGKWGPHLDDVHIYFHEHGARAYASRGQQKLIMIILKLAAVRLVNEPILLLVDDMFADFDTERVQHVLNLLANKSHQVIMTAPMLYPHLEKALEQYDYDTVSISKS